MKQFIQPNKKIRSRIDKEKMDAFISVFNSSIRKNIFSLNSGLDKIPVLNDAEFKAVQAQAKKDGYLLQINDDNYQTVTYQLQPLQENE